MTKKAIISVVFSLLFLSFNESVFSNVHSPSYYSVEYSDYSSLKSDLQKHKIKISYHVPEVKVVQIIIDSDDQLTNLNKNSNSIIHIGPTCSTCSQQRSINKNNTTTTNDKNLFDLQWDMKKITHDGKSYSLIPTQKNAKVAIIDTGVNVNHPDLKSINKIRNEVPKHGYRGNEKKEQGKLTTSTDKLNHGTLVAGQIGANGNLKGINPGVEMNSYRVFGESKSEIIWIAKAIVDAANDDNDIINLSLGSYLVLDSNNSSQKRYDEKVDYDALQKAINYANNKGSIVVVAAGNNGIDVKNEDKIRKTRNLTKYSTKKVVDIPASLKNVLTIGSIDSRGIRSEFSNFGEGFIDLVTIGGSYRLLDKFGEDAWLNHGIMQKESILTTSNNGRYIYQSGTSLAAPKVSGALSTLIDKHQLKDKPKETLKLLKRKGIVEEDRYMVSREYGLGKLDAYKLLK